MNRLPCPAWWLTARLSWPGARLALSQLAGGPCLARALRFLNGITGHGFLKIMRAGVRARYEITALPPVPEVLQFLADELEMAPAEAYSTLNMGAGYVAIVSPEDAVQTVRLARETGHEALIAGEVTEGPRSLVIPSLGIEYRDDDLRLR